MQPDGTLNPSPTPTEEPDPSDSGPSYWLARTIWALGEGYAAFRGADPAFAGFLRERLELSLDALDRQVLDPRYGTFQTVDGLRLPAWLIVDGRRRLLRGGLRPGRLRPGRRVGARPGSTCAGWPTGVARMPLGDVRATGRTGPCCPGRGRARCGTPGATRWPAPWPRPGAPLGRAGLGPGRGGRDGPVHPAPARPGRARERLAAGARPTGPRSPTAPTPPSRTCSGPAAAARRPALRRPGRDRRRLVLRQQPGRGGHVRPRHRADLRRHQPRPDRQPQLGRRVDHPRPAVDAGPGRPSRGGGPGPGRGRARPRSPGSWSRPRPAPSPARPRSSPRPRPGRGRAPGAAAPTCASGPAGGSPAPSTCRSAAAGGCSRSSTASRSRPGRSRPATAWTAPWPAGPTTAGPGPRG